VVHAVVNLKRQSDGKMSSPHVRRAMTFFENKVLSML
jgi:hypothetical protein